MLKPDVKLWRHQEKMVKMFRERSKFVLWFAGCGTGKTLASLYCMDMIKAKKTLVLTTKTAIGAVWVPEIDKWTVGFKVFPISGSKMKRDAALSMAKIYPNRCIVVMNYEYAWKVDKDIEGMGFDLVIADESHKLQGIRSKVSVGLAKCCRNIPYKIAMTGTLMEDNVSQVYGQVRFLDCSIVRNRPVSNELGHYKHFSNYFEITKTLPNRAVIVVGHKNLDILTDILSRFTVNLKSEDYLDLPNYRDVYKYVGMTLRDKRLYKEMLKHKVIDLHGYLGIEDRSGQKLIADSIVVQLLRLHEISLGHYSTDINPLLRMLLDTVDEIGNKPVVIFVRFKKDVVNIANLFQDKVNYLTGDVNELDAWNRGEHNILVANIAAGSESIDLTRAHYVIYYSKTYSRTAYIQSRFRVYRPPANIDVTYFHLIVKDTVGQLIEEALSKKGKVVDYLIERLEELTND